MQQEKYYFSLKLTSYFIFQNDLSQFLYSYNEYKYAIFFKLIIALEGYSHQLYQIRARIIIIITMGISVVCITQYMIDGNLLYPFFLSSHLRVNLSGIKKRKADKYNLHSYIQSIGFYLTLKFTLVDFHFLSNLSVYVCLSCLFYTLIFFFYPMFYLLSFFFLRRLFICDFFCNFTISKICNFSLIIDTVKCN